MTLQVRRIVTGHSPEGKAIFEIDDVLDEGQLGVVVWSTATVPIDNLEPGDGAARDGAITAPGSLIRVMSLKPGLRSPMHRTQTLDYGIVLEGEIDLELDDGAVKRVHAGEVVVQRGTIHAWVNNGDKPCKVVFVLIAAEPLVLDNNRVLEPTHI